jgi:uncharacterized membrane protein YbhN (UPF0104 family)
MQLSKLARWFFKSDQPNAHRARRLVGLAITIGLLVALFWIIPVRSVIQALRKTNLVLFLVGVMLALVTVLITSVQMKPLLDNQRIERSILQIYKINLVVKFYLLLTPTSLVASGIRWYRFAQPEGKVAESLVALAFIRVCKTFITLTLGLGFLLISTQRGFQFRIGWIALLVLGITLTGIVITRYTTLIYTRIRQRARFLLDRSFLQSFSRIAEKLLTAASAYADMPMRDLLYSMTAGVLAALVGVASGLYLARAIGMGLGFLELGWALSMMSLATQSTLTIMEGLGVREVTLVTLLSFFNISAEQAMAFSFLIFGRGIIIALIGGLIEVLDALRRRRGTESDAVPGESIEM